MYDYPYSNGDEHQAECPVFCDKDGTIQKCNPQGGNGHHFYPERDSLMDHKVLYVRAQFRMIHQPLIQTLVATEEKGGRQKEKWGSGENREECIQNTKSE
jgi:hypothetical protein